ncbi:MAG TPA: bifunctional salicylyl-CoA 5-hydroxylase/oxidoreductase [Gemmatimonadota bacterium]|nr:bifunctional salicylyl-CoA 5-hydroxylase/oxidoreductase [Gemmatimonadota bacterium]
MRVVVVGGGPAGLYLAILLKRADPAHEVTVYERNRPDDTYGFGVVFSDATMEGLAAADPETFARLENRFHHWDDIDVHYRNRVLSSTGHGFSGLERSVLLEVLAERARELGVDLRAETEVIDPAAHLDADLVVGADGVNSGVRERWRDDFGPAIDWRPNKFVWMGTTRPFDAFTFDFQRDEHGLWRLHAYRFSDDSSTFIVESTDETLARSGLADASEAETIAYCEALFADRLEGHRLIANRSIWRSFPTLTCAHWSRENVVLIGDAAHTAHFSVGSGTKLAMEDGIALAAALGREPSVPAALAAYEAERKPEVESLQRAAQASLQWFEGTERYMETEPIQFAFNLLTRSLRITHEDLKIRDPAFTADVDRWFAAEAQKQSGVAVPLDSPPPPLFTPFRLRDLVLANRVVVSAMCQYLAEDGMPNDWHFVHLGSRAIGGAGLVMAEMTDVSAEGRISPGCAGLYRDEHVQGWKRIVDFVHAYSRAAIGIQLGHAGRKGSTRLAWEGADEPLAEGGWEVLAPSPIPWAEANPVPRAMVRADMDAVIRDHVRAAERADAAGFDLLEVHMAHGYLLATFISPLTNRREDEYGGSVADRMRFPLEVVNAVRAAWPAEKPLSVRISAVDWAPGGQEIEDSLEVARLLAAHDIDIVDVSAGQTVSHAKPRYGRQFQTPFSDRIRHEVGVPTMAVGNISSYMDVNTILAAGRADLCALARAHLWDPYWARNAAWRMGYELRWPDPYSTLDGYTPRFE